jgi:hypothetical protein
MLLDRDVFSGGKAVIREAVTRLVVVRIAKQVVMKRSRPTRLANKMPDLISLSTPEAAHAAAGAIGLPVVFADVAIVSQWRGELIAPLAASVGKVVIARKLQADFGKAHKVLLRS